MLPLIFDRLFGTPFLVVCFSVLLLSAVSARRHGVSSKDLRLFMIAGPVADPESYQTYFMIIYAAQIGVYDAS
jgi:hypothetical protein